LFLIFFAEEGEGLRFQTLEAQGGGAAAPNPITDLFVFCLSGLWVKKPAVCREWPTLQAVLFLLFCGSCHMYHHAGTNQRDLMLTVVVHKLDMMLPPISETIVL
jgi:hypothetical protein